MTIKHCWLNYSEKETWLDWLGRLPNEKRDVYFYPDYIRLYTLKDNEACCFVYSENDKLFIYPFISSKVPLMETSFDISTPYGYGGPVANTSDNLFLSHALEEFYSQAKGKNIIAEVIKFHPLLREDINISNLYSGKILSVCPTVYVDTQIDPQVRWEKIYTHANRKNIKKAKRNNFTVNFSKSQETWSAFKNLYSNTMKANMASEIFFFSDKYFARIQKHLAHNYILAACHQQNSIVAVLLVLFGKHFAHCHLIGTNREVMKYGVNNLLHHELINWCAQQGHTTLHIGGGRGNDEDDPLLKFKMNFTDKQTTLMIGENILDKEKYHLACQRWEKKHPSQISSGKLLKYRL